MARPSESLRLIQDPPAEGDWNMSVDQALLETVEDSGSPVLRFYGWTPATLSLGYFQAAADRERHPESLSCPVVRRTSGGGAIVHDREVTYSLCLPSTNRWSARNTEVYRLVHDCITDTLNQWSIRAIRCGKPKQRPSTRPEFLCFQRHGEGDLLLEGHKIVGSAQRRSRLAVLQHGSILFGRSHFAPQLPGLQEISGQDVQPGEFIDLLLSAISNRLAMQMVPSRLTDSEHQLAERIRAQRFGSEKWTWKRRN